MTVAYLGLGANLGETYKTLQHAMTLLTQQAGIAVCAQSSFYRSAPVQADGADYTNCVAKIETALQPRALLQTIAEIELHFGRTRPYRNAPRLLDIDLLLYGKACIHEIDLIVPHPRLTERAFVLVPLLELAPDIEIPQRGSAMKFVRAVSEQRIARIAAPDIAASDLNCSA